MVNNGINNQIQLAKMGDYNGQYWQFSRLQGVVQGVLQTDHAMARR